VYPEAMRVSQIAVQSFSVALTPRRVAHYVPLALALALSVALSHRLARCPLPCPCPWRVYLRLPIWLPLGAMVVLARRGVVVVEVRYPGTPGGDPSRRVFPHPTV